MRMSLGFGLGCLISLTAACSENETTTARRDATTMAAADPAQAAATAGDAVSRLLAHGALQVELGRLAAERSADKDVRELGRDLADDHTRLREELRGLADSLGTAMPSAMEGSSREQLDRLTALSGEAFDRAYLLAAVSAERSMLDTLQSQGSDRAEKTGGGGPVDRPQATGTTGSDQESVVSEWAAKTIPTVQAHLDRAQSLDARLNAAGRTPPAQ
jgi:predicted outer membrane protein